MPEDHDPVEVLLSGVGELNFEDGLDCCGKEEISAGYVLNVWMEE